MEETVRYICAAASINCEEQIFVPEVGEAVKIIDLANFLIEHAGESDGCEATISYSGCGRETSSLRSSSLATKSSNQPMWPDSIPSKGR